MSREFQEVAPSHVQPARLRGIAFGSRARQKLDVYLPKDRKPRAVIVFLYGGGWTTGSRRFYRLLGSALNGRGFAVVVPDYRLFPSARFPDFVEDGAAAVKWVRDNAELFARAPVFLMGHSAGAHIGALLTLVPDYLRSHGIEPSFVRGFIGISGPYTLDPTKWPVVREVFSTAVPGEIARPIKLVRERVAPMLLLHGKTDRVVALHNSERFTDALKAVGSDVALKTYPRIGHIEIIVAFAWGWRWRASVLDDVDAFISAQLAPNRQ